MSVLQHEAHAPGQLEGVWGVPVEVPLLQLVDAVADDPLEALDQEHHVAVLEALPEGHVVREGQVEGGRHWPGRRTAAEGDVVQEVGHRVQEDEGRPQEGHQPHGALHEVAVDDHQLEGALQEALGGGVCQEGAAGLKGEEGGERVRGDHRGKRGCEGPTSTATL